MNYYSLEQNVNAKMCTGSLIKRPLAIRQGRELLGAPRPLGGSQWLMNETTAEAIYQCGKFEVTV